MSLAVGYPPPTAQPYMDHTTSSTGLDTRRQHTRRLMLEVVRLISDLVTIGAKAFLTGAILAPTFIISTFAFGTAMLTIGGSATTTLVTLALVGGSATALLSVLPHVTEHIKQAWIHIKWIRNPKKMAEQAQVQQTRFQTRIALISMISAACLAAIWPATASIAALGRHVIPLNGSLTPQEES